MTFSSSCKSLRYNINIEHVKILFLSIRHETIYGTKSPSSFSLKIISMLSFSREHGYLNNYFVDSLRLTYEELDRVKLIMMNTALFWNSKSLP